MPVLAWFLAASTWLAPLSFALGALLVGGFALYARRMALRAVAFCWLLLLLGGMWVTASGLPRPMLRSGLCAIKGVVAGYEFDEPRHIYLWMMDGNRVVAYAIPFETQFAINLQKAMKIAERDGGFVRICSDKQAHASMSTWVGINMSPTDMFYAEPVQGDQPKPREQ